MKSSERKTITVGQIHDQMGSTDKKISPSQNVTGCHRLMITRLRLSLLSELHIQTNFNGSNTYGTMKSFLRREV